MSPFPLPLTVWSNAVNFDGANGTGMDFTLAESAVVNLSGNVVTDNVSGGTGILFNSIAGPSSVAIDGNMINLLSPGAVLDRGIIFTTVDNTNGPVALSGTANNVVTGAIQPWIIPNGTTTGQFFVNGFAVP